MDDLRERLEAVRLYLQQSDSAVFNSIKSPIILSHVTTVNEALDHPERLMGEPVAWIGTRLSHDGRVDHQTANLRKIELGNRGYHESEIAQLYAPKEVKP